MKSEDKEKAIAIKNNQDNDSVSKKTLDGVIYLPGEEPDRIHQRIDRLFKKLDEAYPDKVIVGLHKDHKKWGETVTELYRQLEYPDGNAFLNAYGYITGTRASGRPSSDPMELVNELKRRYSNRATCQNVLELAAENPDLAPKFKNLQNRANKLFGMSLARYFAQEGIILTNENNIEEKLMEITNKLKERYPENQKFTGAIRQLILDNEDLSISRLNTWTEEVYKETAGEYLVRVGIMEPQKSIEDKLAAVTASLKDRYGSGEKKAYSITELIEQNSDLPISAIGQWSQKIFKKSAKEYLSEQGIISKRDAMEKKQSQRERKDRIREEQLEAQMKAPIETVYYEPQVYIVPEIDVRGEEANEWEYMEGSNNQDGEVYIADYLGDKDHIVIPAFINGKHVANLDSFGLKTCKASIVEIPGSIKNLAGHLGFQNENIQTVIIGEGVETIGESCFSFVKNLKTVKVSRSVIGVGDTAFEYTPWYKGQDDLVIIGSVLTEVKQSHVTLNIPEGIKIVGKHVVVHKYDLRKVILPKSVTTLCEAAFSADGNYHIKEFVYTDSLTNIGVDSFGDNIWTRSFGNNPIIINNQLYQYKVSGNHVVIPDGVTKICNEVFKGNKEIKSVVFPKTLKIIGEQAFGECQNLTSISLPEGLEQLEMACFYGCKKLSNVSLPDSLITIGRSAFNSCSALTEIALGDSVEEIGTRAFIECQKLRKLTMNDKVRIIGEEAFENCMALQKIELPDSVVEIGRGAFYRTSLDQIIIPSKVKKICSRTFYGCKSLKTVSIGSGIEEIEDYAFAGCDSIKEMKLPKAVSKYAFLGCSALEKVSFNPKMPFIDEYSFAQCTNLIEIVIPNDVTEIRKGAFSGCTNIRSVTLSNGLTSIGQSAFYGCKSLKTIIIPHTVRTVEDNAFKDCTSLSEVIMSDSIEKLGLDVFTNSPYLKKEFGDFVIMNGVLSKYLGADKEVIIPNNVSTIGENAFAEAYHVETIIITNTVKTIANNLFGTFYTGENEAKPQLNKVVIGDGVVSIGDEAFKNCEKLTEVVLGKSLSYIGQKAFSECTELKSIDFSKTALIEIKEEAFKGCYNIDKLDFPSSIENIGPRAFFGIRINTVNLPKGIKKVERSAFYGVSELIVYDTIDPEVSEANGWEYDCGNGTINSPLACAMLNMFSGYFECQGNTNWKDYHITVLSTETGEIRYRIFCDTQEKGRYRAIMFSAWGKNASFKFNDYDEYFMQTRNKTGRAEMAFCRLQYPEGLNAVNRANYEAYIERCMYIERSAKRIAQMIAEQDAVERLEILRKYNTIDEHNIGWIREIVETENAEKCREYLDTHYSK